MYRQRQKESETPEQAVIRQLQNKKMLRSYHTKKLAEETTEDAANRWLKQKDKKIGSVEIQIPEEGTKRRTKFTKYNQTKQANKTPEQAAKRRLKRNLQRLMLQAKETPEENAKRRLKEKETTQKSFKKKIANETQSEAIARKLKRNEKIRNYRLRKLATETPEEAAERILKQKEYMKKRRQMAAQNETPEKRLIERARKRNYAIINQANETPEHAAERRLKQRDYMRRIRQMTLENETPEQTAERLSKQNNYMRKRRKIAVKDETPKQDEEIEGRWNRVRKLAPSEAPSDHTVQYENILDEWDGSSTWTSFEASDKSYSRSSIKEEICSSTATKAQTIGQYKPEVLNEGISETHQHNGCFFEISEIVNSGIVSSESFPPGFVQDIIVKEEVDL